MPFCTYEYDLTNRLVREIQPEADEDGNPYTIEYRFDGNGNQVAVTDANGNTTEITFDAVNRTTAIRDANGVETRYSYDNNDNLTSLITRTSTTRRISVKPPTATTASTAD